MGGADGGTIENTDIGVTCSMVVPSAAERSELCALVLFVVELALPPLKSASLSAVVTAVAATVLGVVTSTLRATLPERTLMAINCMSTFSTLDKPCLTLVSL